MARWAAKREEITGWSRSRVTRGIREWEWPFDSGKGDDMAQMTFRVRSV